MRRKAKGEQIQEKVWKEQQLEPNADVDGWGQDFLSFSWLPSLCTWRLIQVPLGWREWDIKVQVLQLFQPEDRPYKCAVQKKSPWRFFTSQHENWNEVFGGSAPSEFTSHLYFLIENLKPWMFYVYCGRERDMIRKNIFYFISGSKNSMAYLQWNLFHPWKRKVILSFTSWMNLEDVRLNKIS